MKKDNRIDIVVDININKKESPQERDYWIKKRERLDKLKQEQDVQAKYNIIYCAFCSLVDLLGSKKIERAIKNFDYWNEKKKELLVEIKDKDYVQNCKKSIDEYSERMEVQFNNYYLKIMLDPNTEINIEKIVEFNNNKPPRTQK